VKKAIFDLDGTITKSIGGLLLAQEINRLGKFKNWNTFIKIQALVKSRSISFDSGISRLSKLFANGIKDLDVSTMNESVQALERKIRIRNSFSGLYKYLKNWDFKIYLLTSSPLEATRPLTKIFPFDAVFSLEFEIIGEKYTGRHKGAMTAKRKKRIVDEEILPGAVFSFGVGNEYEDTYVFQNANVCFLFTNNSLLQNGERNFISVKNFKDIMDVLEKILL
jgi:phosphoserine phosphatase